jgi:hypothetical protein
MTEECIICFNENKLVKWSNNECKHSFCHECTKKIKMKPCPLCRRPWINLKTKKSLDMIFYFSLITFIITIFNIIMTLYMNYEFLI